ncbi:MAG: hypothetical protein JXP34_17110 [Planctomycetes bacterium]|nr:hypothetical protein [Planctomycetota bacterium]
MASTQRSRSGSEARAGLRIRVASRFRCALVLGALAAGCGERGIQPDDEPHAVKPIGHRFFGIGRRESCEVCHEGQELRPEAKGWRMPEVRLEGVPRHGLGYLREHGQEVSRDMWLERRESCFFCHPVSSCDRCHRREPPRDHTNLFRRRTHGWTAEMERERCAVCHREAFCVRCHRTVRPQDHSAAWGGTTSRHCTRCHEPLAEGACYACHKGTPSHRGATPIPPPPHPAATSDCYTCHLHPPHADDFGPCARCHR